PEDIDPINQIGVSARRDRLTGTNRHADLRHVHAYYVERHAAVKDLHKIARDLRERRVVAWQDVVSKQCQERYPHLAVSQAVQWTAEGPGEPVVEWMPRDLIEWLACFPVYRTEAQNCLALKMGMDHTPRSIAAEWAVRRCGFQPWPFK